MRSRDVLLAGLALLVGWQVIAMLWGNPILPPPSDVAPTLVREMQRALPRHFVYSAWRILAGLLLAVLLGVPLGLAMGQSKQLDRFLGPIVYLLYPIPKIVFVPIILLLLGLGETSKIFTIFIVLFFQVLVVVRDQASALRPELIASVRSLGAGRRALFRYVYLPATIPASITALRVSVGIAVAVLYITELTATQFGLGYYIGVDTQARLAYREMYAGVIAMSLLGLGLYIILDRLERRFAPWLFVS